MGNIQEVILLDYDVVQILKYIIIPTLRRNVLSPSSGSEAGDMFLRDVMYLRVYTGSQLRSTTSSPSALWESLISQCPSSVSLWDILYCYRSTYSLDTVFGLQNLASYEARLITPESHDRIVSEFWTAIRVCSQSIFTCLLNALKLRLKRVTWAG
jgi:hypothetical protein